MKHWQNRLRVYEKVMRRLKGGIAANSKGRTGIFLFLDINIHWALPSITHVLPWHIKADDINADIPRFFILISIVAQPEFPLR